MTRLVQGWWPGRHQNHDGSDDADDSDDDSFVTADESDDDLFVEAVMNATESFSDTSDASLEAEVAEYIDMPSTMSVFKSCCDMFALALRVIPMASRMASHSSSGYCAAMVALDP